MEDNVNTVCKKVNFHLRNIWKICKYLNKGATEALIHALISSRIDYCNSLLYDIPSYSKTLLHVLFIDYLNMIMYHILCTNFTGCQLVKGSNIKY